MGMTLVIGSYNHLFGTIMWIWGWVGGCVEVVRRFMVCKLSIVEWAQLHRAWICEA